MAFQRGQFRAGRDIPQPCRMVMAARGEDLVVRRERDGRHVGRVTHERQPLLVFDRLGDLLDAQLEGLGDIPQPGKPVHRSGRQNLAVRRKLHAADAIADMRDAGQRLAGVGVPQL